MMLRAFRSCSSEITSGGAKRMMLPWVGLACLGDQHVFFSHVIFIPLPF